MEGGESQTNGQEQEVTQLLTGLADEDRASRTKAVEAYFGHKVSPESAQWRPDWWPNFVLHLDEKQRLCTNCLCVFCPRIAGIQHHKARMKTARQDGRTTTEERWRRVLWLGRRNEKGPPIGSPQRRIKRHFLPTELCLGDRLANSGPGNPKNGSKTFPTTKTRTNLGKNQSDNKKQRWSVCLVVLCFSNTKRGHELPSQSPDFEENRSIELRDVAHPTMAAPGPGDAQNGEKTRTEPSQSRDITTSRSVRGSNDIRWTSTSAPSRLRPRPCIGARRTRSRCAPPLGMRQGEDLPRGGCSNSFPKHGK